MALDVCQRAEKLLSPYVRCILTRNDDTFISLSERPKIANRVNADAFVSYHFNSGSSQSTTSSWEIFTTPGQNNSDRLATCIGEAHKALFQEQKIRADFSDGDLDKEARFAVIRGTRCPSALMEGEFIHTRHGEALIASPEARQKMALAVAIGTLNFLGVTHTLEPGGTPLPQAEDKPKLTLEQRIERLEALHPEINS